MVDVVQGLPPIMINRISQSPANSTRKSADAMRDENKSQNSAAEKVQKNDSDKSDVSSIGNSGVDYQEIANKLQGILEKENIAVEFTVDQSTEQTVMKVVDSKTHEVIKQLPPEEMLKIARMVAKLLESGQLTNAKI